MKIKVLLITLTLSSIMLAQQPFQLPLYPNGVPNDNGLADKENITSDGRHILVHTPSITVFRPAKAKNNGSAVVICPGGGYHGLAFLHEGTDIAAWLAENGFTGVVLRYRMPNGHTTIPLQDAQQAMELVRSKASEWGIDPDKVGVMGSSAGGHLASTLSTHYTEASRPNFSILFYPVITMDESFTHMGSRKNLLGESPSTELLNEYSNEKKITPQTPPALLLLADDDEAVVPRNSIEYYMGLKRNNVDAAMYIFPEGKHGFGFNKDYKYHEQVKTLILEWLTSLTGLL